MKLYHSTGLKFKGHFELLIVGEEGRLRLVGCPDEQKNKNVYIEVGLDLLTKKLGLNKDEVFFDSKSNEIKGLGTDTLSSDKRYYIDSFVESIDLKLKEESSSLLKKY